jgi:hypothetical protein
MDVFLPHPRRCRVGKSLPHVKPGFAVESDITYRNGESPR